jgi:hypothetical protein
VRVLKLGESPVTPDAGRPMEARGPSGEVDRMFFLRLLTALVAAAAGTGVATVIAAAFIPV